MEGARPSKKVPRLFVFVILLTVVLMVVENGASAFPRSTTPTRVTQPRTQQRRRSSVQVDAGSKPGSTNFSSVQKCSMTQFQFHLIINNAVGGAHFPRDSTPSPAWNSHPFLDFMNNINNWQGPWQGENHALKVDYIRVYAV